MHEIEKHGRDGRGDDIRFSKIERRRESRDAAGEKSPRGDDACSHLGIFSGGQRGELRLQ